MSNVPRIPLGDLVVDERPQRLHADAPIWNLNLDQIESDTGRILERVMVPQEKLGPSTYPFAVGTVLYSKLRPYLNKVVVADESGYATTELVPLRCDPQRVMPSYLAYFLRSADFLNFANTVVAGAKMPRMVMSEFWKYEAPLPSLAEQRRIAAILDQADALRAKRREALAQLDRLAQSIFVEMFGDPATNPKGWQIARFEDVSTKITDGEHLTPMRQESGIKLLSARNVRDGFLDLENVDYVGEDEYARISKRCNPEYGDILISCSGSIGRVAAIETNERLSLVRSAALVKPDTSKITSKFIEHWLRTPYLQQLMVKCAHSSSQANLFQGPIRALPVLVPPLQKQVQFDARLAHLAGIGQSQRAASTELSSLFLSLQHRAFRGEL